MANQEKIDVNEAMLRVMRDVTSLKKLQENSFQKFNFRGIDDVMQAFGPSMRKHGLRCIPVSAEAKQGEKQLKNGVSKTVDLICHYRWYGPDGSHIDSAVAAESFDSGDKATAKAMSVALRTLFLQAFCLPTEEPDPDSYSYKIQLTQAQQRFLDRINETSDLESLRAMWNTAKEHGMARYLTDRVEQLSEGGK